MLGSLFRNLLQRPSGEALREAGKRALDAGDAAAASRLFESAVRKAKNDGEAWLYAGLAKLRLGAVEEALSRFERCIALVPASAEAYCQAATARHRLGDSETAKRYCENALAREPAHVATHHLLAKIDLPGPRYTELLTALHQRLAPRTYVEIGVATGDSLAPLLPSTRAVGIDPQPRLTRPVGPNVQIYRMLSDEYFEQRDLHADLGGAAPDLAFIDGAHIFDQALRDFINVEQRATRDTTILLHDTYPLDRFTSQRTRRSPFWSGDVWRLVLILRKYRPDLVLRNVATAPTGLCIVRNLDPSSRVLADNLDAIIDEFMALDYGVLDADKAGMLGLWPNDLEEVLDWVGGHATGAAVRPAARAPA